MFPHLPNKHWFFFFFYNITIRGKRGFATFQFLPSIFFHNLTISSNEEFIFLRFSIIPKQRSPKLDYEWTRNDAVNSLRTTSFSRLLVTLIDDRLFRLIASWIASSLPRCIILENYLSLSARSVHGSFIAYANNQNLIETLCPVKLPRSPIKKKKKILTPWDRATNYKFSPTLLHVDRIINTPIRYRRETSFRIFSSILNSIWNERESPVFRIHNFWKLFVLSSLSFTLSFSLQLKLKQLKRRKKWIGASLIFSLSYIKILSLSNKCWSPHFAGLSIVTSETITIMKFLWERIYPKLLIQCFR